VAGVQEAVSKNVSCASLSRYSVLDRESIRVNAGADLCGIVPCVPSGKIAKLGQEKNASSQESPSYER